MKKFQLSARGKHLVSRQNLLDSNWRDLIGNRQTVAVGCGTFKQGEKCPTCGFTIHGPNHENGDHHRGTVAKHKAK